MQLKNRVVVSKFQPVAFWNNCLEHSNHAMLYDCRAPCLGALVLLITPDSSVPHFPKEMTQQHEAL